MQYRSLALAALLVFATFVATAWGSATEPQALQVGVANPAMQDRVDHGDFVGAVENALSLSRTTIQGVGWTDPRTARALQVIGACLERSSLRLRAKRFFQLAATIQERAGTPDPLARAESLYWLSVVTRPIPRDAERMKESRRLNQEALDLARGKVSETLAAIWQQEGNLERASGRLDTAEALYRKAWAMRVELFGNDSSPALVNEFWLANVLAKRGQTQLAATHFESVLARRTAQGLAASPLALACEDNLLRVRPLEHPPDLAEIEALEEQSSKTRTSQLLGYALRGATLRKIAPLPDESASPDAERFWKLQECRVGVREEESFTLSTLPTDSQLRDLRSEALRWERRVVSREFETLEIAEQGEALLALLEVELELSQRERASLGPPPSPKDLDLEEIQASLETGSAILGFVMRDGSWTPNRRVWAYVIRPEGPLRSVVIEGSDGSEHRAWRKYRAKIQRAANWPFRLPPDPDLDSLASEIGPFFFGEVLPLLDGVEHLIVVTPGEGLGFGLEGLRLPSGEFVGDRFDVSFAFSTRLFTMQREAARSRRWDRGALVAAAPGANVENFDVLNLEIGSSLFDSALDDVRLRSLLQGDEGQLPELPLASHEARRVAAIFAAEHELASHDDLADLRRFEEDDALATASVVHLATHAVVDIQDREHSFFVTSLAPEMAGRGRLTARELELGWELKSQLVVLSACQTGGVAIDGANSLGLYHSLLRAGATSVVASAWKVEDAATFLLMDRFYSKLAKEPRASKARALSEAKREVREYTTETGSRPFSHPAYWTGFFLVGDPY